MQLSGHTILLTGGSSGIGLALAQRFVAAGNVVIVTGRRDSALDEVRRTLPSVLTVASDSGNAADRTRLAAEASQASRATLDSMFARLNPAGPA